MARECGLMPHVDTSVVGGVKGVGFAKILGCVHDARIRYTPPPTHSSTTQNIYIEHYCPPFTRLLLTDHLLCPHLDV